MNAIEAKTLAPGDKVNFIGSMADVGTVTFVGAKRVGILWHDGVIPCSYAFDEMQRFAVIERAESHASKVDRHLNGYTPNAAPAHDPKKLLRQALRYIETELATRGKLLDKAGVQRELERVKRVSTVGTGRTICSMANVDLDAIREVLGEETALSRNSRPRHEVTFCFPGSDTPTKG